MARHFCTSTECGQHATEGPSSYPTSLSTDTLWDPKSEPALPCKQRPQNFKQQRPNTVYHQSYTNHYIHTNQVQPVQNSIATTCYQTQYAVKPKSWDNLAAKGCGGYVLGYTATKHPSPQVVRHDPSRAPPIPRKSGHGPYRYSAFADVENYVPAPQAYMHEATITKTTIITTKSTENLISNAQYNLSNDGSCDCTQPSPKLTKAIVAPNCLACNVAKVNPNPYQGYYSLRNNSNHIPTKTEITRL